VRPDPNVVVEALREAEDVLLNMGADRDDNYVTAALPHAERIAELWPQVVATLGKHQHVEEDCYFCCAACEDCCDAQRVAKEQGRCDCRGPALRALLSEIGGE
jgi:hypothetical protein